MSNVAAVYGFLKKALAEVQTSVPDQGVTGPVTPMIKDVKAGPKAKDGSVFSSRVTELSDDGSLKQASPVFVRGFMDKMAQQASVTNATPSKTGPLSSGIKALKDIFWQPNPPAPKFPSFSPAVTNGPTRLNAQRQNGFSQILEALPEALRLLSQPRPVDSLGTYVPIPGRNSLATPGYSAN